jgi:hypothetical protein
MPTRAAPRTRDEEFIYAMGLQAKGCEVLDSPLNAHLLRACISDFKAKGPTREILDDWKGSPVDGLVATRFIGGPHHLVLTGQADDLAKHYPSVGGTFEPATFDAALFETLKSNIAFMRNFIKGPPQTNETRRAGVLLGGFLRIAQATGKPLRCLEVGASAGLNLLWDRFWYKTKAGDWGQVDSPVIIDSDWRGPLPDLSPKIEVVEVAGCDLNPINLGNADARTRMEAYVWADHNDRVERLRAAMQMAQDNNISVDKADAADWIRDKLATLPDGQATVLYHSIAAQYFDDDTNARFNAAIRDASQRATNEAPFAWLRFEHASLREFPYLVLTIWPGGIEKTLAQAHPHGLFVDWA